MKAWGWGKSVAYRAVARAGCQDDLESTLKMLVLTFRGGNRCSLGHRKAGQKRLGPIGPTLGPYSLPEPPTPHPRSLLPWLLASYIPSFLGGYSGPVGASWERELRFYLL